MNKKCVNKQRHILNMMRLKNIKICIFFLHSPNYECMFYAVLSGQAVLYQSYGFLQYSVIQGFVFCGCGSGARRSVPVLLFKPTIAVHILFYDHIVWRGCHVIFLLLCISCSGAKKFEHDHVRV